MHEPRKKHLIIILVIMLSIAGFLTYQKYAPTLPVVATSEVKSGEVVATRQNPYSQENFEKHLAINPSNIVWFTNYYRTQNHLAPLRMYDALNRSAHQKNADMFRYDYFEHIRPADGNEKGFEEFIDDQNYVFIKAGENLARGDFKTSRDIVDAWMQSDSHRHNILDANYADIGVSIDTGRIDDIQTVLFTQHFGLSQKKCPVVDSSKKTKIENIQSTIGDLAGDIKAMEATISAMDANSPGYNDQANKYNTLVGTYNGAVNELQSLVTDYNKQVQQFDQCVKRLE